MVPRVITALLLVALTGGLARAQEQRASIEGTVKDSSGAVLSGVTVEARSPNLVGIATAATDAAGIYRLPALRPGIYEISAKLQGFSPARVENIELALGQVLKVNLTLAVAGIAETVQVRAASPVFDVRQNAVGVNISREVIARIPKGRDFTEVIAQLAPGAQSETKAGGIQIDGASGSENRFIINGADTTALRTGRSGKEAIVDFLEEVQVKSSGYNAEFRAATGGVVSTVTKSGSGRWHGQVGTYYSSNDFLGQQRPSLRLNPTDQRIAEYVTFPDDEVVTHEPLAELGGPILKDRLWVYTGHAFRRIQQERTVTFVANNQRDTFESKPSGHNFYSSLTGQIASRLRGRFASINERDRGAVSLPGIEPDGTSLSNPALFPIVIRTDFFNDLYSGVLDWIASSNLYVNVTSGYLAHGSRTKNAYTGLRHEFSGSNFQFPEIPPHLRNSNGYVDAPSNFATRFDDYSRFTLNGDATRHASWFGQHSLKGGIQFERISNEVNSGEQAPRIILSWDASYAALDGRRVRGRYGYYTVRVFGAFGDISTTNLGLFVQDSWRLNDRLTLNLGIRAEREDIPSYRPENPGIHFSFGDKIAPRLGFAWDLKGNNKWKAYGSWGMFYDLTKLELPRDLFGANHWVNYYITLDSFDWPSITCSHPPVLGPNCLGQLIGQVDFRVPSNAPDAAEHAGGIDPNLQPMRSQEFVLGLDHELTRTMSVGARYVRKWLDRTIEDVGVIVPSLGEVYYIANPGFGLTEFTLGRDFPAQPKAKRNYDAIELRVRKRFDQRWSLTTSYTHSKLRGNYSGLANSDEDGRTSPNVNRVFDGLYNSFDANGRPVFGPLQTDRPHVYKAQLTYDFPWGTGIGLNQIVQSGTPQQRQILNKNIPVFYRGRLSDGRTPTLSSTSLLVQHDIRLGRGHKLNVEATVFNLFDQDTVTRLFTSSYRDSFNVSDRVFFNGWSPEAVAAADPRIRPDPRFGLADQFQGRRGMRFALRYSF